MKTSDNDNVDIDETESKQDPSLTEAGEAIITQHPLLAIAQDLFLLSSTEAALTPDERRSIVQRLTEKMESEKMDGLAKYLEEKRTDPLTESAYKYLTEAGWKFNSAQVAQWTEENEKAVTAANAKIKEAEEIAGDTEVREAMYTRANVYVKSGSKDKALEELNLVFDKTVGIASKLDVLMAKLRISLTFLDTKNSQGDANLKQFKQDLDKAKTSVSTQ